MLCTKLSNQVEVSTAFLHSEGSSVRIVNPFTVKLDNRGSILSIVVGMGDATASQEIPARLVDLLKKYKYFIPSCRLFCVFNC